MVVSAGSAVESFAARTDDGERLWVDNQLLIDHWVDDWDDPQTAAPVTLTAGTAYDITVEYFEDMVGRFQAMGIDEFVLYWPGSWPDDLADEAVFREVAREVIPRLRSGG